MMLAIAWSDAATFRIPDALSLPAIPLGLLASGRLVFPSSPNLVEPRHVIGMLAGGAGLWLVRVLYRRIRQREGLGFGDAKLGAAAGAWIGIDGLGPALLLACVAAIGAAGAEHWRHRGSVTGSTVLPFGAALAPAIWVVWFSQILPVVKG